VIILAYDDPAQVRRLIRALRGLDVFVHCDGRSPDHICAGMTEGAHAKVRLLRRRPTGWGDWTILDAELRGLRAALDSTAAEHLVVASGSCYPLVSAQELQDDLAGWRGMSRFRLFPLPFSGWNTPRLRDGGLRRLRWRYLTVKDHCVYLGRLPVPLHPRKLPADLVPYGHSSWRIYARRHAVSLLEVLDTRPDLVRFFRTSHIPHESCPGSILRSPSLVGPISGQVRHDCPWHIDWPEPVNGIPASRPRFLNLSDLPVLRELQARPRRPPDTSDDAAESYRRLFARKLRSTEPELLEAIDEEFRR
jgi:hypothetical protein